MHLTELGEHVLAETEHTGATGVIPATGIGAHLRVVGWQTGCGKGRQHIRLGIEGINGPGRIGPVAWTGLTEANTGSNQTLAFLIGALIGRADLEQGDIGHAAVCVTACRLHQVRQQARAHHRKVGRDRVDDVQVRTDTAKQIGTGGCEEGPGHRLVKTTGCQCATHQP